MDSEKPEFTVFPDGYLSDEYIEHGSPPFKRIQELHAALWAFVRAVMPGAGGHLDEYVGPAFDRVRAQSYELALLRSIIGDVASKSVMRREVAQGRIEAWLGERDAIEALTIAHLEALVADHERNWAEAFKDVVERKELRAKLAAIMAPVGEKELDMALEWYRDHDLDKRAQFIAAAYRREKALRIEAERRASDEGRRASKFKNEWDECHLRHIQAREQKTRAEAALAESEEKREWAEGRLKDSTRDGSRLEVILKEARAQLKDAEGGSS